MTWKPVILGDLLTLKYGKALGAEQRLTQGRYPVVGSAGEMSRSNEALSAAPIVVIGRKGAIGRIQYLPEGGWPSDTCYFSTIPDDLSPAFLVHQLRHLHLERYDSSTATPSLRRQDVEVRYLALPDLDEQRRIVEILEDHLSRLDAAAAYLRTGRERLARLADGLLAHEYDVAAGDAAAPLPPVEGVDDSTLPGIPSSWTWQRLGELADVVGGVTKDAKRQSDPSFVEVPYLRVANVQRGRLDLSTLTMIRVPPATASSLRLLRGDVLLNEGGDRDKLGRGWVWEEQVGDCIHQNHVFRARVRDDAILPELLSAAANTVGGRWCQRNGTQSVNLASISLRKIRLMPVPVPPRVEQPRIAARVAERRAAMSQLGSALTSADRRLDALRRSLLAAAFSGRLTGRYSDMKIAEELVAATPAE